MQEEASSVRVWKLEEKLIFEKR